MRTLCLLPFVVVLAVGPASAREPVGCDKFKWPVEKEMAALRAPDLKTVASGADFAKPPVAATLRLSPVSIVHFAKAPERAPRDGTFGGYLSVGAATAGRYSVGLSGGAWVDVLQDKHFLKSQAHSGVLGCAGIRKVVQFDVAAGPFVVQVSGARTERLNIAILPAQ